MVEAGLYQGHFRHADFPFTGSEPRFLQNLLVFQELPEPVQTE